MEDTSRFFFRKTMNHRREKKNRGKKYMYRLLIADDEMIERKVLFKTLSQNLKGQCEIFQAENGREALEIYEKEKIQIAILDIEMPGINGIQAAERIREKDKKCCIIFLTAFSSPAIRMASSSTSINSFSSQGFKR